MRAETQRDQEKEGLVDSRLVYSGRIDVRLDTYQLAEKTKTFELVLHPGAVVILPIDSAGRLLLIQQWRRAVQEIMTELPAGTLEENEPPAACAKRELQEETGFATKKLTPLGGFFSAPGFCNEFLHLFVAEELYPSPLPPDDDERIDLLPTPLDQALRMVEEGKIRDAKSIAGLFKYQLWQGRR